MQKIWLNSYPPGVPSEVDLDQFASVADMFESVCKRYGEHSAFTNQGATLTWQQLDKLARRFAAYLHKLGLGKGDRIAIMLPNLLQYPIVLYGAFRAGCVVVNINPQYTARELQHQLADSGAVAIVVLDNFSHTLEDALASTALRFVITTRVGDMLQFHRSQIVKMAVHRIPHLVPDWCISGSVHLLDALTLDEDLPEPQVCSGPDDIAFLQYTGGTSGVPKGAILTHRNILANVEQTAEWERAVLAEGQETAVVPLPLYHMFAMVATLVFCRIGAHIVLITNPRDVPSFVQELRHTRFTALIGVNTLFKALLDAEHIGELDVGALKVVIAGGMALQRSVAERWQQLFGVPITEGYGLTEASTTVCANPFKRTYTGSIGLPMPSTEVALLDEAGNPVGLGEIGEICVRGPQVMKGYWNRPEETALAFTRDGWLRTGDMGRMGEDGFIKLVDRKKDVIIVSGFKVFPNEIEEVVGLHPGVFEVAAIRVADAQTDEAVKIVVVRRDSALTQEDLIAHCQKNLAPYKVPKYVSFRTDPLPKSNVGRVLRRLVSEEESQLAAAVPAG
ncbi:MAG: AMP-binding protein [Massilia sp.]